MDQRSGRCSVERRLTEWVEAAYRPSYGQLAARLPTCWPEHPFCLFILDWLCELHAALWLQPRRPYSATVFKAERLARGRRGPGQSESHPARMGPWLWIPTAPDRQGRTRLGL